MRDIMNHTILVWRNNLSNQKFNNANKQLGPAEKEYFLYNKSFDYFEMTDSLRKMVEK
jgi:hypothetical protein